MQSPCAIINDFLNWKPMIDIPKRTALYADRLAQESPSTVRDRRSVLSAAAFYGNSLNGSSRSPDRLII